MGAANSWMPSVILEGRVTRRLGALESQFNTQGDNASRFIEMYVHDAVYGHQHDDVRQPEIASTNRGHRLVLPHSSSAPERHRVVMLFQRIYEYVRHTNQFVHAMVCAAEDMQNMDESMMEHSVLLICGKRSREQVASDQQDRPSGRSPFAVSAGQHGRLRGMPEMCVLCPRTIAEDERSGVLVKYRQGGLDYIPIEHRAYDCLYNVLLHPTGYCGWEDNMPLRSAHEAYLTIPPSARTADRQVRVGSTAFHPMTKVSMRAYYAYRCHWRHGHMRTDNCMFMTNRLFQEYACVAFWRVETARLNIHRLNQEGMREARVSELRAHAEQLAATGNAEAIGRISYLPESFVGGPQDMYAKYQDAIAAVLHHGPPSLFITMTANPKWSEIQKSLPFGQMASDRPDIVTRIFNAKLNEMLNDLKRGLLGVQVARVHVIEFQQRGLPHAHIVVVLAEGDRPRTEEHIDQLSTAELPPLPAASDQSPEAQVQRKLRELVLEHMVHNDCSGPRGRTCPCWDDQKKKCGGNFPFDYAEATVMGDERGKAKMRRRRGSSWTAQAGGRRVTNEWVVPYNASLLLRYECHLNVEVVTAAYAIKYLFKYLFKGSDNASAAIHTIKKIVDQIGRYQDHRYLGAAEAFWRIFSFSIHDLTQSVERMVVEIPDVRYGHAQRSSQHTNVPNGHRWHHMCAYGDLYVCCLCDVQLAKIPQRQRDQCSCRGTKAQACGGLHNILLLC